MFLAFDRYCVVFRSTRSNLTAVASFVLSLSVSILLASFVRGIRSTDSLFSNLAGSGFVAVFPFDRSFILGNEFTMAGLISNFVFSFSAARV